MTSVHFTFYVYRFTFHVFSWHKKTLPSKSDEKVPLCRQTQTRLKLTNTPCSPRRMSIKGSRILLRPEESCQAAESLSHRTPPNGQPSLLTQPQLIVGRRMITLFAFRYIRKELATEIHCWATSVSNAQYFSLTNRYSSQQKLNQTVPISPTRRTDHVAAGEAGY